jgi:hypothetical protein
MATTKTRLGRKNMFEVIKAIASLMTLILILRTTKSVSLNSVHLVSLALWFRFSLSAFHQFTFEPIVAGLSINALGSIAVVLIGMFFIPKSYLLYKKFIFLYAFLVTVAVSTLVNGNFVAMVSVYIKWFYMLTLSILMVDGFRKGPLRQAFKILLLPFFLPIILFVMSFALGVSKPLELDGSISYIGGYFHEAGFSIMIAGALLLVCLLNAEQKKASLMWVISLFIIVFLVNYRTTMLAVIPLTAVTIFYALNRGVSKSARITSQMFSIGVLGFFFSIALIGNSERFVDFSRLFAQWDTILQAPQYFSRSERVLFSARLYIWSQYIYEFYQADLLNQLVGHGPESWNNNFNKYAHNTFVSYLYEYGVLGLGFFIMFILHSFLLAIKIPSRYFRSLCIMAYVGFVLLNMSTMPFWSMEGIIFFSLFYALILFYQLVLSSSRKERKQEVEISNKTLPIQSNSHSKKVNG